MVNQRVCGEEDANDDAATVGPKRGLRARCRNPQCADVRPWGRTEAFGPGDESRGRAHYSCRYDVKDVDADLTVETTDNACHRAEDVQTILESMKSGEALEDDNIFILTHCVL